MNQYQPHQVNLTNRLVEEWIEAEVNVLIQGEYGVGKTSIITSVWDSKIGERNKDWVSFSGATIDPWIDLIGIPRVSQKSKTRKADERDYIEYILPQSITENLQAIFIDELNRTKPVVLNALMELIQFKSINGRKFPKLKLVWGAINPYDEDNENSYHVERLDKAQMDRFHVIVEMPYAPSRKYFASKLGKNKADMLINWWDNQGEANKNVSPRRLEYAINYINSGGDAKHVLPKNVNTVELQRILSSNSYEAQFVKFFTDKNERMVSEMMNDDHIFENIKSLVIGSKQYWPALSHLPSDLLIKIFEENDDIADWGTKSSNQSISFAIQEVIKTNSKFGNTLQNKYNKNFVISSEKTSAKELALEELLLEEIGKRGNHKVYMYMIDPSQKPNSLNVSNIAIPGSPSDQNVLANLSTRIDNFSNNMWDFELNNSLELSHVIGISSAVLSHFINLAASARDKNNKKSMSQLPVTKDMAKIINTCTKYLKSNGNTEILEKVQHIVNYIIKSLPDAKELFVNS